MVVALSHSHSHLACVVALRVKQEWVALHCSVAPAADEHFGTLLGVLAGSAEIEDCTCAGSESAQLLSVLRPLVLQQLIPKVDSLNTQARLAHSAQLGHRSTREYLRVTVSSLVPVDRAQAAVSSAAQRLTKRSA